MRKRGVPKFRSNVFEKDLSTFRSNIESIMKVRFRHTFPNKAALFHESGSCAKKLTLHKLTIFGFLLGKHYLFALTSQE